MKAFIKCREIKEATKIIFIAFFVLIMSIPNVAANTATEKSSEPSVSQIDQTPMYSNPKYSNENLNTGSTLNNDQNKLNAPPPGEPDPGNQIPVSSSILPLLFMALGLVLWKAHYQLRKARK